MPKIPRENTKQYPFCTSGKIKSLECLFKFLKNTVPEVLKVRLEGDINEEMLNGGESKDKIFISVLCHLLHWTRQSSIFSTSDYHGNNELVDEVALWLLEELSLPQMQDEGVYRLYGGMLWCILINGWFIYLKYTDLQFRTLQLILKNPMQVTKGVSKLFYFEDITNPELSPLELFHLKFHHYPPAFFPEFCIRQKNVQTYVFDIKEEGNEYRGSYDLDVQRRLLQLLLGDEGNRDKPDKIEEKKKKKNKSKGKGKKAPGFGGAGGAGGPVVQAQVPNKVFQFSEIEGKMDMPISQEFFSMPLSCLLLANYEVIELAVNEQTKTKISMYTYQDIPTLLKDKQDVSNQGAQGDQGGPEEQERVLQEILREQREIHKSNSQELWKTLQHEIKSLSEVLKPSIEERTKLDLMWRTMLKLFEVTMAEIIQKQQDLLAMATSASQFVLDLLSTASRISEGYTKCFPGEVPLLPHLQMFILLLIGYLCYPLGAEWEVRQAHVLLPMLTTCIREVILIFKGASPSSHSLLNNMHFSFSEEVDYPTETVFETSHPYGRGEISTKENYHFPMAIGVLVIIDPRSQTDSSNDSLQISSIDQPYWPGESISTNYRFSGYNPDRAQFVLIGNRATLEFRVGTHSKRKYILYIYIYNVERKVPRLAGDSK